MSIKLKNYTTWEDYFNAVEAQAIAQDCTADLHIRMFYRRQWAFEEQNNHIGAYIDSQQMKQDGC